MVGNLLNAVVERESSSLDERALESAKSLFLRHRRDKYSGLIERECLEQPQEIRVASKHREIRFSVKRRSGLNHWSARTKEEQKYLLTLVDTV